jgi:hypothetical protein
MKLRRPRRSRPSVVSLLLLLFVVGASGCVHWHVGSWMPSAEDLLKPPYPLDRRGLHPETDPREDVLVLNAGPSASADVLFVHDDHTVGARSLGGEVSLHWARNVPGHGRHDRDVLLFPERTWALNVGWTSTFLRRTGVGSLRSDDVYLELQRTGRLYQFVPAGFAAGPVLRLGTDLGGGAQFTGFAGPFYARATFVEREAILSWGIMVKFPVAWVWRRPL